MILMIFIYFEKDIFTQFFSQLFPGPPALSRGPWKSPALCSVMWSPFQRSPAAAAAPVARARQRETMYVKWLSSSAFSRRDFHSTLVLNKRSSLHWKTAARTHTNTKVCPLSFILLHSGPTSCVSGDVTAARGLADQREEEKKKKKQVVEAFVETGSKQGESRAEVLVVRRKKTWEASALCFPPPVILSSLKWRGSCRSVAWTPLKEGSAVVSRRSGRTNGYLSWGLALFALPQRPPHWN